MMMCKLTLNALSTTFSKQAHGLHGKEDCILTGMIHNTNPRTQSVAGRGYGLPPRNDLNLTTSGGFSLVQMLGQHQRWCRCEGNQSGETGIGRTFSLCVNKKNDA